VGCSVISRSDDIRRRKSAALARRRLKRRLEGGFYQCLGAVAGCLPAARRRPTEAPRNILMILRGQRLGDAVISFPFSLALKQAYPGAVLSCAAPRTIVDVLACDRHIDRTYALPTAKRHQLTRTLGFWRSLRARRFDLAFVLGIHFRSALMGRFCAAYAVGYDYNGRGFLLDKALQPHPSCNRSGWEYDTSSDPPHITEFWGRLIQAHTGRSFPISWSGLDLSPHRRQARRFLGRYLAGQGPLVALHPWAGGALRCWPPEHVDGFLDLVIRRSDWRIVITGGPADARAGRELSRRWGARVVSAAGHLSTGQTWALLEGMDLVVSVDTCLIHMAAALNKPVVSLFGAGDPLVWGPYGQSDGVLQVHAACQRCKRSRCLHPGHPCMTGLTPELVWTKASQIIAANSLSAADV
jgi:lipopolysaccharide heptosyltransferase II